MATTRKNSVSRTTQGLLLSGCTSTDSNGATIVRGDGSQYPVRVLLIKAHINSLLSACRLYLPPLLPLRLAQILTMDTTEHLPPPPTAPSADTRLLAPTRLSALNLAHHLVLAPLTRLRAAHPSHVPSPFAATYYAQRAAVPGTLLITEATFISARAGGYNRVPGLWSDAQIAAWKAVVDAVHARGSFIFPQLWALGRAARPDALAAEGFERVSASDVPLASASPDAPRPLTIAEIKEYVADYANAARRAVHEAGFDGVEVHGANGYLIDQFLQDVTNIREDDYGGSVEKRCRFGLEVVKACCEAVGEERVGIRLSPWSEFQGKSNCSKQAA